MNRTISTLDGALVFEMKPRTRRVRIDTDRMVKELEAQVNDPALMTEYEAVCWLVNNTDAITTHSAAPAFAEFACWWTEQVHGDTPLLEWVAWFTDNAWEPIYNAWWQAFGEAQRQWVDQSEAAPELLTDGERNDPKSQRPAKVRGKS